MSEPQATGQQEVKPISQAFVKAMNKALEEFQEKAVQNPSMSGAYAAEALQEIGGATFMAIDSLESKFLEMDPDWQ